MPSPIPAPGRSGFGARGGSASSVPYRSAGRFLDGADTESNCRDFQLQPAANTLAADSAVSATNIKVASAEGLAAGQTIEIDMGANRESAIIATVPHAGRNHDGCRY